MSSTTTYTIAPAANAKAYGNTGSAICKGNQERRNDIQVRQRLHTQPLALILASKTKKIGKHRMKGNLKEDDDKNKQTNKQTENKTERNNTKKKGRVFQMVDCQWTGLLMGL